jgi:hypothetical protein
MLSHALHLRGQNLSLRDIATRLVISKGKKKGQHPSPATVLRMFRDHDQTASPAHGSGSGEPVVAIGAADTTGTGAGR